MAVISDDHHHLNISTRKIPTRRHPLCLSSFGQSCYSLFHRGKTVRGLRGMAQTLLVNLPLLCGGSQSSPRPSPSLKESRPRQSYTERSFGYLLAVHKFWEYGKSFRGKVGERPTQGFRCLYFHLSHIRVLANENSPKRDHPHEPTNIVIHLLDLKVKHRTKSPS